MTLTHLAILALLGLAPEADPTALVAGLGSSRFTEREAAASALERLGGAALPALRGAAGAKDPEVQTRAAALASKIERDLMVRPSTVTLDFRDRPLDEVVRTIAGRSGIPVVLAPENPVAWRGRRVTLEEPEPVPFWTAIDRLCRAGQLNYSAIMPTGANSRRLVLQAGQAAGPNGPTVDSGPFRVALLYFEQHRRLDFTHPAVPAPARVIIGGRGGPPAVAADRAPIWPTISEQFTLSLQVLAEPRLMISQGGPPRLLEAVDDRGQSLLPPSSPGTSIQRVSGYSGYNFDSNPCSVQMQIPLKLPDKPGQFIKILRGSIPLAVSAAKPDPLVIPLAGAAGKTFRAGDAALTIHEVKDDPMFQRTTVELTVRGEARPEGAAPGPPEFFGNRPAELVQNRLEILDARGNVMRALPTRSQVTNGETRLTLMLMPTDGAGAPAQVRYFDLARTTAEATFEFTAIRMPVR